MRYTVLLLLLTFISCTSTPDVSGGSSHGNFVRGKVKENGMAVGGAEVSLLKAHIRKDGINSEIFLTTTTDAEGVYTFEDIEPGTFVMSAEKGHKRAVRSAVAVEEDDDKTIPELAVTKVRTIFGRVIGGNTTVSVIGLNRSVATDSDGFYTIDSVPMGKFEVLYVKNDALFQLPVVIEDSDDTVFIRDVTLSDGNDYSPYETDFTSSYEILPVMYDDSLPEWYVGKSFSDVTYTSNENELIYVNSNGEFEFVLEDFEAYDIDRYSIQISSWYPFHDSISDIIINEEYNGDESFEGKCMFFQIDFKDTTALQYGGIGLPLYYQGVSFADLSEADSIVFMAKGAGELLVTFESKVIQEFDPNAWQQYETSIELKSDWQEYRLSFDDLALPSSADSTYPSVREALAKIGSIEFGYDNTDEGEHYFYLDDITLIGVNPAK